MTEEIEEKLAEIVANGIARMVAICMEPDEPDIDLHLLEQGLVVPPYAMFAIAFSPYAYMQFFI